MNTINKIQKKKLQIVRNEKKGKNIKKKEKGKRKQSKIKY